MRSFSVSTPHGACPVHVFEAPGGHGPAVLMALDGGGVRQAMFDMASALASRGFTVLLPDLFFRSGSPMHLLPEGTPKTMGALFGAIRAEPAFRQKAMENYLKPAQDPANVAEIFSGVMQLLDGELKSAVTGRGVGITGYCMGGGVAFRVGAQFPERIKVVASFHGGNLATPAPDSPHLGVPKLKAEVLVAGAEEDATYTDEMRDRLVAALQSAGVKHTVETWKDSRHGFAVNDTPVFKPEHGARHLEALTKLFGSLSPRGGAGQGEG